MRTKIGILLMIAGLAYGFAGLYYIVDWHVTHFPANRSAGAPPPPPADDNDMPTWFAISVGLSPLLAVFGGLLLEED